VEACDEVVAVVVRTDGDGIYQPNGGDACGDRVDASLVELEAAGASRVDVNARERDEERGARGV